MAKKTTAEIIDKRKTELLLFTAHVIKPMLQDIGLDLSTGGVNFGPLYRTGRLGFVINIIDSMGDEVRQLTLDIDSTYREIADEIVRVVDVYRARRTYVNLDGGELPAGGRTVTGLELTLSRRAEIAYQNERNLNFGRMYGMNQPFRIPVEISNDPFWKRPTTSQEENQPKLPKRRIRNKSEE